MLETFSAIEALTQYELSLSLAIFGVLAGFFAYATYQRYYKSGRKFQGHPMTLIVVSLVALLSLAAGLRGIFLNL